MKWQYYYIKKQPDNRYKIFCINRLPGGFGWYDMVFRTYVSCKQYMNDYPKWTPIPKGETPDSIIAKIREFYKTTDFYSIDDNIGY